MVRSTASVPADAVVTLPASAWLWLGASVPADAVAAWPLRAPEWLGVRVPAEAVAALPVKAWVTPLSAAARISSATHVQSAALVPAASKFTVTLLDAV
jgi:hypothetical protein